ncbi:MAG: hypothetical protein J5855_01085 [Mailhella sp.]|nr:hypothetical protein [Mailhella sp.]
MRKLLHVLLAAALAAGCASGGTAMADTKDAAQAVLSFDSFDGGGPEYKAVLDSDIVSVSKSIRYRKRDHEELDGAGFDVVFTLKGLKPGEARLTVEERSPIGDNENLAYAVKVDEQLNVTVTHLTTEYPDRPARPVPTLVIEANGTIFYASPESNPSAAAFVEKLSSAPIEVRMRDYGGFEKVGPLPWSLERSDERITTVPGDVILYNGDQITVYYDTNTWDFTRLAKIGEATREKLLDAFGKDGVTVRFWVEWSE